MVTIFTKLLLHFGLIICVEPDMRVTALADFGFTSIKVGGEVDGAT